MLSARDVTELIAAERLGLLPDPWLQTGVLASVIANCHTDTKGRPYQPVDFIPKAQRPRDIDAELLAGLEARRGGED